MVVITSDPRGTDEWVGEPIGVVVAPGVNQMYGYPGVQQPLFWQVAFSGLEYMVDGRGPFENAMVPEWRLEVVDPSAVDPSAVDLGPPHQP